MRRLFGKKWFLFIAVFIVEFSAGIAVQYFQSGIFSFHIFRISADHSEFLHPTDILVKHGRFAMGPEFPPYAGRMPGYIVPYLFFRFLFEEQISLYLLGLFQLAIKALAAVFLWSLVRRKHSRPMANAALAVYLCIPYCWHWDYFYHPNSVSVSVYTLLLCLIYEKKYEWKHLLFAGTLGAWLFFIRPFLGLYYVPFLFYLFFYYKSTDGIRMALKAIIIFLLPLLVAEAVWTTRNYISIGRLIPFQTSFVPLADNRFSDYDYGSSTKYSITKVRKLIASWGGESVWFFPGEMRWFMGLDNSYTFEKRSFTESLNQDSMRSLKEDILRSYDSRYLPQQRDSLEHVVIEKAERYVSYYRNDKPVEYWMVSKIRRLIKFLGRNMVQDWPGPPFFQSPPVYIGLKLLSVCEYGILLLSFSVGFFFCIKERTLFEWMIIANIIILIFTFSVLIEASHYTYFITGYAGLVFLCFNFIFPRWFFKVKQ